MVPLPIIPGPTTDPGIAIQSDQPAPSEENSAGFAALLLLFARGLKAAPAVEAGARVKTEAAPPPADKAPPEFALLAALVLRGAQMPAPALDEIKIDGTRGSLPAGAAAPACVPGQKT